MNALFWLMLWASNLLLVLTGAVWYVVGWRWALAFLVGGPLVMIGAAAVGLVVFFFVDGGLAREVPCEGGCGQLAPVQLRGQRYRRPLCDQCERQRRHALARAAIEPYRR